MTEQSCTATISKVEGRSTYRGGFVPYFVAVWLRFGKVISMRISYSLLSLFEFPFAHDKASAWEHIDYLYIPFDIPLTIP